MRVQSIRYLEACRETEDKNIVDKRGDKVREGGTRGQILAPEYFWDPPRHSIFYFERIYKNCKKKIRKF